MTLEYSPLIKNKHKDFNLLAGTLEKELQE